MTSLFAAVPEIMAYQGRVQVGTNDFNGTGQFKFALVNADGMTTYWSNDGTGTGQPAASVALPVTRGLYSVHLGSSALPNMTAVPPAAFTNSDVHLRVWFNDGVNGFQQFVPDQRIASVGYAMVAGSLSGPIGIAQLPASVPRTDVPNTFAQPLTIASGSQESLTVQGSNAGGTSLNLGNSASSDATTWNLISTGPSSPEGAGKLLFRDQDNNSVRLAISTNGSLGIGPNHTSPLATAHIRAQSLNLAPGALQNDNLIVEATDATLGLYSANEGNTGSGLALKEVTGSGQVRDSWALVRNSSTAGSDLRLTYGTSANHATNPPVLTVQTNGTTTIAGDVIVTGSFRAASVDQNGGVGASGLPAGTTLEVLINNKVAPGVRFEGLAMAGPFQELRLSRVTSDLSWPDVFHNGVSSPFTNPPVSIRLSLPNGGVVSWNVPGGSSIPTYLYEFLRVLGSDGKPYDFVKLKPQGGIQLLTRSNFNLSAVGAVPRLHVGGMHSGQPPSASVRLVVDNVNYNNVLFVGSIDPQLRSPSSVYLNPTHNPTISQWALGEAPERRSVQVVLAGGLPGTVQLAASTELFEGTAPRPDYVVIVGSDGLPIEKVGIGEQ